MQDSATITTCAARGELGSIPRGEAARQARAAIRAGRHTTHTAGMAPGFVQGNLCILPKELAMDFAAFCQRNPKPCPLIGVSAVGDPMLSDLGDIDIRTDIPRYRVYRHGELVDRPTDITALWRDDLVAFVLGCSYSFEQPLLEAGIALPHITHDTIVPMYRTNVACTPAGSLHGPMVVSMRPLKPADAIRAVQITSRFPAVHGAPVHIGHPHQIGIADIRRPDWGDPPIMTAEEIPVFWACGVTPQAIVAEAKPELCITHEPGSMLITDKWNADLAAI